MKNKSLVLILILVFVVLVVASAGVTYAVWTQNAHDSVYIRIPVEDENPSLKYQMYVPVRDSGNSVSATSSAYERISGTFTIVDNNYTYTLTNPADDANIVGYALVGYYGGIALEYIEIPNEINGKPVVRAMVDPEFSEYSFKNNRVLKSIIINGNVKEIDEGMFMNMHELESVTLRSNEDSVELYVKNYAFANCIKLKDRISTRAINEECNESLIYWGSGG